MLKKTLNKQRGSAFLLGNEAIVRGALEMGVNVVSTYPGTPTSEIGDTFSKIAKEVGIYFEYSTNEKVALEIGIGASLAGFKSLVAFKHFGLNVALDSLLPSIYLEPEAGLVIAISDDPQGWSSIQSEQDSRYHAPLANIPMLEPADPQEAKNFVKEAFLISEKFKIPVLIRTTTRVNHVSALVKLNKIKKPKTNGVFKKDYQKFNTFSPQIVEKHKILLEKMEKIKKYFEESNLNYLENNKLNSPNGIITSGVSFCYLKETLKKLGLKIPILKVGTTYPLPQKLITQFIKNKKFILIIEELGPFLENKIKEIAKEINPKVKIKGKDILPAYGEFNPEIIETTINKIFLANKISKIKTILPKLDILRRFPVLCPGCPHRATFFAVKSQASDVIFAGDIGCYMLGFFPPYQMQDFIYAMGAGLGIIQGIKRATNQKVISFIGDSTFFHAGFPSLINAVYNKSNFLLIVLDNRITAMTGHQPNPGTGLTGMSEETYAIKIENIARACGIKNVKTIDPYKIKEMKKTVKEFLNKDHLSVIVAKRECILVSWREKRKKAEKIVASEINQNICKKCGTCVHKWACPAIKYENKKYQVKKDLCSGCGVCIKICPFGAIKKEAAME